MSRVFVRTEVVVVDGGVLEVEASVAASVIGGVRVVARGEPVVENADVWVRRGEFVEFVEVPRSSVVDLVPVGQNDAPIESVQEVVVGFIEGADEDAFVVAEFKEAEEAVSSFRFGEALVSGVIDPENA